MNFLAHLWLADRTATSLAGSVLGDVVRGADLSAYPEPLALGIRLHRRVDAATDRHPLVAAARQRFAGGARRYAGIVLDLACDHALALDWARHGDGVFTDFCRRGGVAIAAAAPWFEYAGGRSSSAAAFSDLLLSYQHPAGIQRAMVRIAARLRDPPALLAAARDWEAHSQALRPQLDVLLCDLVETMRAAAAQH